jgi:tetratricopeptide (TPR) repeat protein
MRFITISMSIVAAVALCTPLATRAQSSDLDFRPLLNAGRLAAVSALAQERLAKSPSDDVALWYLGRLGAADARRREALLSQAERCVKDLPQSARCHNLLGHLYGAMAVSAGLTAGLKYAGKVKEAFETAANLEPGRYEFRRDMNQFFLQAPALVGGSVSNATRASLDFATHSAAHSNLLMADVHIYKKELARAESLLAGIAPGNDANLRADLDLTLRSLGSAWLAAGDATRAESLFERQVTLNPGVAGSHFGLGRALLALKKTERAIAALERAVTLDPNLPAHHALGLGYLAQGEKTKALVAFRTYLASHPNGIWAKDAREQMEALDRG